MKKVFSILVLFAALFILSGCYNYSVGIINGQLLDIKIYTLEEEELEVTIEASRQDNQFISDGTESNQIRLNKQYINSPAPVWLYYTVTVEDMTSCYVELKIKENYNRTFESVYINNTKFGVEDVYLIEEVDEFLYVTLEIQNITEANQSFAIGDLYFTKTAEDETTSIVKGTTWVEGRTYISGFYFYIDTANIEESPEV